jgi:hypothetical protein
VLSPAATPTPARRSVPVRFVSFRSSYPIPNIDRRTAHKRQRARIHPARAPAAAPAEPEPEADGGVVARLAHADVLADADLDALVGEGAREGGGFCGGG